MEPPRKRQRVVDEDQLQQLLAELPPELQNKWNAIGCSNDEQKDDENDHPSDGPPNNLKDELKEFWKVVNDNEFLIELNNVQTDSAIEAITMYIANQCEIDALRKQCKVKEIQKMLTKTPVLAFKNKLLSNKNDANRYHKMSTLLLDVVAAKAKVPSVAFALEKKLSEIALMVCDKLKIGVKYENGILPIPSTVAPIKYPVLFDRFVTRGYDALMPLKKEIKELQDDIESVQLESIGKNAADKMSKAKAKQERRNKKRREDRKKKKDDRVQVNENNGMENDDPQQCPHHNHNHNHDNENQPSSFEEILAVD
mmetsp:Transcript_39943/g.65485  ORF Transcript_39943/g.65485 Transcript_39943/m.65485 type:complete len:311 (+) Transcript_39943:18-950(+)